MEKPLTAKQNAFCVAYTTPNTPTFGNAAASYRSAYNASEMKQKTVECRASELLAHGGVAESIKKLREKYAKAVSFTVRDVLNEWIQIVTADPNDITQYRRENCRYCHGINHEYQWVEFDFAIACARAIQEQADNPKKQIPMPTAPGGFGFNRTLSPNAACPKCQGEGEERVFIEDTRRLKGAARKLYAGIKQKRDGIEILFRSQDQALENLAKFLGMFKDGSNLLNEPKPITPVSQVTKDPVAASKIYQQIIMGGS